MHGSSNLVTPVARIRTACAAGRFATLALLGALVASTGCEGDDGSLGSPDGSTATCKVSNVETAILAQHCGSSACHDSMQPQVGLDLVSPGVADRVVNVLAATTQCTDRILVVAGDPDASYLIEKLTSSKPQCGSRMPLGSQLDAEQLACVKSWIQSQTSTGDAGPRDGAVVEPDGGW